METIVILGLIAVAVAALVCYVVTDNALIGTKAELLKEQQKNLELARTLQAKEEEEAAQLQENLEMAEHYAADLEEEKNELLAGYSTMATTLEAMQTDLDVVHKWMNEYEQHMGLHCARLDLVDQRLDLLEGKPVHVQFMALNYDGYTSEEEPYSESDCPTLTPLPEYVQTAEIEGLNEL